ncbi:hypothetical protein KCP77_13750 [Salmonella enterica subsp. enterica]|nr:hypothetical protein KCP77_13750 [Salmonella enterica subsp. enterica]
MATDLLETQNREATPQHVWSFGAWEKDAGRPAKLDMVVLMSDLMVACMTICRW